jgi:tetratricopeptide (TPR) repeat protein
MIRNGLFLSLALGLSLLAGSAEAAESRSDEGARLFAARKFEQARLSLEGAVRDDPADALAASYLGRVYLAEGSSDLAIEWMERSIALEPSSAEYHLWLGRAYGYQAIRASVLKQPALAKKVRKEFEQASRLDPDSLEARFGLIEFYLQAPGILGGSEKKAKEQAEEVRKRDALQGHRAFGRIAEHGKDFDQAFREYERAGAEFPEKAEPAYWTGALYTRRKEYAKAFDVYEKLLEKNPAEMAACYQIGRVAALSGERLERGAECLRSYLLREPGPDDPSLASAHYRLGLLYEKKGSRELARREYSAALEIEPTLADARQALKKIS